MKRKYIRWIFNGFLGGWLLIGLVLRVAHAQTETGQVYVVQHSDTLWRLAEKYLGEGKNFPLIVAATAAQAPNDPSLTPIADPNLLHPGQKLWIPASTSIPMAEVTPSTAPAVSPAAVVAPSPKTEGPSGHLAFSFWNNHPDRCTYEVNIIEVATCLQDANQCQATRRIVPLNNISEPALSPDGSRLAFRAWGAPPGEDNPYATCASAYPARLLGNTTLAGTNFISMGGFWEDSHPDWSPNGQRLIFDTGRDGGDDLIRIMTINPDGSDEGDLRLVGQQPSWAPDNERFVYRGCDFYGNGCGLRLGLAVAVKPWETGNNLVGAVLEDAEASHPDWSPVSDEIVYQSPKSGSWDLYIINADGSGQRRLTTSAGLEGLPAWSPDGQWLAYVAYDGAKWSLRIIRRDGSADQLLLTYDGGFYALPKVVEPYGVRDWLDEQISWSR